MFKTTIQWTDSTHNFWSGCNKVSEGCKFCYMHRIKEKGNVDPNKVYRSSKINFNSPIKNKTPNLIFTCSMSDFFIKEADAWRDEAWEVIRQTPHHTWQILTKRPERIEACLPKDWGAGYPNVWLGVTVENQKTCHRMETLAQIPAHLRFISAEPLLEEVDLLIKNEAGQRAIDAFGWVIIGGESGNEYGPYRYRPCKLSWMKRMAEDLKQHTEAKVFIKQMGTHLAKVGGMSERHGGDFEKFPTYLQLREMP